MVPLAWLLVASVVIETSPGALSRFGDVVNRWPDWPKTSPPRSPGGVWLGRGGAVGGACWRWGGGGVGDDRNGIRGGGRAGRLLRFDPGVADGVDQRVARRVGSAVGAKVGRPVGVPVGGA